MTASFNRSAGQELIAAARKLAEVTNLGGAFLDEYEAWEAQIKRHPLSWIIVPVWDSMPRPIVGQSTLCCCPPSIADYEIDRDQAR